MREGKRGEQANGDNGKEEQTKASVSLNKHGNSDIWKHVCTVNRTHIQTDTHTHTMSILRM